MEKIKQVNTFNFFTIQSQPNEVREWHLSALVDIFIHSDGIKTYEFDMSSISCKDKETGKEYFYADNPSWILNTLLPYLKIRKDNLKYQLNDREFDKLDIQPEEIDDVIEVIEKAILIGLLKDE